MKDYLDRALSAILTVAAVVVAATLVHREFFSPEPTATSATVPTYVKDWQKSVWPAAVSLTGNRAAINIVEFGDLECPYCKAFDTALRDAESKYQRSVAVYYVHYPLPMHRFALPAARAAECARARGQFSAIIAEFYKKQDSLGLIPWGRLA